MKTQIDEKEFARGFDDACWLVQIEPTVAKELQQEAIDIKNDYLSGFKEGLAYERNQNLYQDFQNLREESAEQNLGRDV
ncbi:MAG: hypothetical protein JWN78_1608 [Bacteroidota bacterium]|nr:hypothetical protein [Bacteroidota bacterium]